MLTGVWTSSADVIIAQIFHGKKKQRSDNSQIIHNGTYIIAPVCGF